jgi:integrase
MEQGSYVDPSRSRVTFGDFAGQWLATKVNLKASTRESYEGLLRSRVLPRWRDVPLGAITHADVAAWVAGLTAAGLSASRVRKCHVVVAQVLDLAVRDQRIARNPASGVPLPRAGRKEQRFLTHEQVHALRAACGPDGLAVAVLAYTGVRWGELAGLRVRDVDLDAAGRRPPRSSAARPASPAHARQGCHRLRVRRARDCPKLGSSVNSLAPHGR